jgi:hypothetical protein
MCRPEEGSGEGETSHSVQKKVEIRGSHSTKVQAIVETLLKLQDTHPGEKALIFSSVSFLNINLRFVYVDYELSS